MVVDDYGHHPSEIKATLETARAVCARAGDGDVPAAPVLADAGVAA